MKRTLLLTGAALVLVVLGYLAFRPATNSGDNAVLVVAARQKFEVSVTATGELESKNSVDIQGPTGMRAVGIWNVKIADLVPEGTVVKKGDVIGSLDRSEIANNIRQTGSELLKAQAQFTQTRLDTSLTLREARDNLENLRFALEERNLELQQSRYEPPATIRQAEINVAKANRAYEQARDNYRIKRSQAVAKMQEVQATLGQEQGKLEMLQGVLDAFTIRAPEEGMVIYVREWNGQKKKVGSTVGAWDPTVATLPDLSKMISRTYVNEVDIRKISRGQTVEMGLDAFPEKRLTGQVASVANVGEQRPNSDAKVFEVLVEVSQSDTTLRPAMTTSNRILAGTFYDVLSVPLECLHSRGDTLSYVFKRVGQTTVRQQVRVGRTNENAAIVEEGLAEGDRVYLSQPDQPDDLAFVPLPADALVSKR